MSSEEPSPEAQEGWLERLSPEEWLRAGMNELSRAESARARRDVPAMLAGLKRAAGMALNGALRRVPEPAWGRTYVEHLRGLAEDDSAPEAARSAARALAEAELPSGPIVALRTPSVDAALVEATQTVMAHAYAVVHGRAGRR